MEIPHSKIMRWLAIILLVALGVLVYENQRLTSENKIFQNNITYYEDSLRYFKSKNDLLITEHYNFISNEKKLKEKLKEIGLTNKEIKELKPVVVSKIETVFERDTIIINVYEEDSISIINYEDEWLLLNMHLKDSIASLNKVNVNTPLVIGLTKDNQTFATSTNPYIKISSIETHVEKKKEKRFGLGINVGPMFGYDCINNKAAFGVGCTVGLSYRLK